MTNNDFSPNVPVAAVVLAAGKSTRMRSRLPKTLHAVCGLPLLTHILNALQDAGVTRQILVVGHQADLVRETMDTQRPGLEYVQQTEQNGTGHAAQMAQSLLSDFVGTVLVLPGDAPLLSSDILRTLIQRHTETRAAATILSAVLPDALSYGRIVRDEAENVLGIVEAKDATPSQKDIREINAGVYAFDATKLFTALQNLRADNAQGELYLTDAIAILRNEGYGVGAVISPDADVTLGVNTRVELAEIGAKMRHKILRRHMLNGVTIEDPATTYIDASVVIGQDTVIRPNTHLLGKTIVGENAVIGANSVLENAIVGDETVIAASYVENARIGSRCKIGPMARLRPGTVLGDDCKIGNFVELKNAQLGHHVAAGHLTYLGDTTVGTNTNIGAGTITCNYDGFKKHQTCIGEDTFVGSGTTFVAPILMGNGAVTGAGSIITQDIPADALGIARERQTNKEDWAKRWRDAHAARRKDQA